MTNLITVAPTYERPILQTTWLVLLSAGIMFLILQFGVTFLVSVMDLTWSGLIGTAAILVFVLAFERFVFVRPPVEALSAPVSRSGRPLFCTLPRTRFGLWQSLNLIL